jgi:hypothetical protein
MAEEQAVNTNSLSYMIGEIHARLASGDKIMTGISENMAQNTAAINRLNERLACLPCDKHDEQIQELKDDKSTRRSFWNDIKAVIISCVLTAILSVGTTLLIVH